MQIRILCVGKIKEAFFRDAVKEYEKRLSRYAKLQIIEAADERTPEKLSSRAAEDVKRREGERILAQVRDSDYCIALAIEGTSYDSVGLSEHLGALMGRGESTIDFIIGGSLGLSPEVMRRADEAVSFSKLTFPHQLMRVILLEQIYRSFRILNHEPYHK
ncbi:MAG: 23S rRNA (pseudouridine(1915)-N(3))-methyltransferase RlmH [Eubacteriales bacterium]|jgi:23S rRNA (pseudouridine1915-N3)-methyltransferase|nr:23S rRNA (pseudouridine(1915)-N(3))-methyltransferase RlmH [Lachnospiraceae bacterium]MDD5859087.1 23S rRNA (pseudouridine(1915)-N(3))-methyltransferase RlmH [Eubacteriales bacterium]MCH4064633.1 23S rRNA (pseudouridine(1915)-N(3))-methyltransferase RlmH [Lachnospiraceae bacterium]MCH4104864.1 23S rRNA (pseudouridine(1915)-N(3))-methyltransferase RlmH [Lachnospiraceae bacterium]MCI1309751.1 23S rRNA (pseudouridine(1915)-N(3))-methyltransferase RlmH [Lachnospiraceae bacterium]